MIKALLESIVQVQAGGLISEAQAEIVLNRGLCPSRSSGGGMDYYDILKDCFAFNNCG